jgi:hypothetical protein
MPLRNKPAGSTASERFDASSAEPARPDTLAVLLATWRSGYAAACKAVYTGSIPVVALSTVLMSQSAPARPRSI